MNGTVASHLLRSLLVRVPYIYRSCSEYVSNTLRKASEQSPATIASERGKRKIHEVMYLYKQHLIPVRWIHPEVSAFLVAKAFNR